MAELSDYLNLRNLLVAGGITAGVVFGACDGEGVQNPLPEDHCDDVKVEEKFVPYGGSFIFREVYDGVLTDFMKGKVTREDIKLHYLSELKPKYTFDAKKATIGGIEGAIVTYGPKRCFDSKPPPVDPNFPLASVHHQLNPHKYGGKDGRMPLRPSKILNL